MRGQTSYGTLSQVDDETVEFVVDGRIQRAWKVGPPLADMAGLMQRCLINLGHEGWRPLSHQGRQLGTVILARVPYTAGSKLSTYGTLRFVGNGELILTIAGAVMQRWERSPAGADLMTEVLDELERSGWQVHRRYKSGATVVRG
jgi:hypothetical protein